MEPPHLLFLYLKAPFTSTNNINSMACEDTVRDRSVLSINCSNCSPSLTMPSVICALQSLHERPLHGHSIAGATSLHPLFDWLIDWLMLLFYIAITPCYVSMPARRAWTMFLRLNAPTLSLIDWLIDWFIDLFIHSFIHSLMLLLFSAITPCSHNVNILVRRAWPMFWSLVLENISLDETR
jgi:hypothetical protein